MARAATDLLDIERTTHRRLVLTTLTARFGRGCTRLPTPTHDQSAALVGRNDELRDIGAAFGRAGTEGWLLIVHGDPGVGKTTLVRAALREAAPADRGALVIMLHLAAHGSLGLSALVDQVCDTLVEKTDNNTLALVTAVRRRQAHAARGREHWLPLMLETQRAVREAADPRPVIVILDNAHLAAERDLGALGALLYGFRSDGACVVVSGWMPDARPGAAIALAAAADQVVALEPLSPDETAELADRRLGWPAAPELVAVLRRDLGRLAGNPRAALLALDALRERDRLAQVDGRMCLADPDDVVPLPGFHAELQRVWRSVPERRPTGADDTFPGDVLALLTRMTGRAETTVDDFLDLAADLGSTPEHLGNVLDTLVVLHLIAVDDRGRLVCPVPALGTEVVTLCGEGDVARLHAAVVLNARRRARGTAGGLPPRLADHALAAGPHLAGSLSLELLLTGARCHGPDDTDRAMRSCLALLRRLPADDTRLTGILRTAISLMLHHGDADGLLDMGDQLLPRLAGVAAGAQEALTDLAPAWAMAALHNQWLGTCALDHDAPSVRAARRVPSAAALLSLAARVRAEPGAADAVAAAQPVSAATASRHGAGADVPLFTGRLPSEAETRVLLAALGTRAESEPGAPGEPRSRPDQLSVDRDSLREALALGDWATSWETVLGDRGVRFLGSPLHSYQAMVREYTTGSWDEALRLARSIVSGPGATAHGALYVCSRSIAADICRWQGDPVRAAAWLENVPGGTDHGPLPYWSLLGLRAGADASGARRQGWRDYMELRARGHVAGMERLLLRVVEYAVRADAVQDARTALGALEDLDARVGSRHTRATTLLARAYVHGDVESAVESYGPLARYGGTELAFLASAWLLDATGDENWLLAAVRWSEGMSSKLARRRLTLLAQQKGLSFPRRRGDRSVLSGLELTVIEKVVAGWTNRQISVALARSEKSVEAYLARIFESTGCRTRMELAKRWLDGDLQSYVPV